MPLSTDFGAPTRWAIRQFRVGSNKILRPFLMPHPLHEIPGVLRILRIRAMHEANTALLDILVDNSVIMKKMVY